MARFVVNLGMCLETSLAMERQVNAMSSTRYSHIRNDGRFMQYVMTDACKTLIHALVAPRQF